MKFNSLRTRFLLSSLIALLSISVVSFYGRTLLKDSFESEKFIITQHNTSNRIINALKPPLLQLQSKLYLYALLPSEKLKIIIKQYIKEIVYQASELDKQQTIQSSEKLLGDAQKIKETTNLINNEILNFLDLTRRERYPTTELMIDKITPAIDSFNSNMLIVLNEIQSMDDSKLKNLFLEKFTDLRYAWSQDVSSTRLMIAGKTGVFGIADSAVEMVYSNILSYGEEMDRIFIHLKKLNEEDQLPFETSDALGELIKAKASRDTHTKALILILRSTHWRLDVPMLTEKIAPLFRETSNQLTLMERRLEKLTSIALRRSTAAIETLSHFIKGFAIFIVFLFVLIFIILEKWIRRPIVTIAKAIEAEGKEEDGIGIQYSGLQEIDVLVDAFKAMQEQIKQRQQLIISILDNAGEVIFSVNDGGIIQLFNKAASKTFGYSSEEAIGENVSILMPNSSRTHDGANFAKALDNTREVTAIRKNNHQFQAEVTTNELFIGNEQFFISVLRDISERKKYENTLRSAKDVAENASKMLGRKNSDLLTSMQTIKRTQKQLIEAEKMASLGGLVAGISHEINTPIGIGVTAASHLALEIKEMSKLLEKGELTKTNLDEFAEEATEASNIILNNLNRAAELVRSFKQVAVDQTSEEMRVFNMLDYIDEIILNLRPKLKRTQHEVVIDCPSDLAINSVPGAYSQIITNLVMNSLIHGYDENQWGILKIKFYQKDENELCLEYSDDGKGMDKETRKKIFEPFFTTKRGQGGSGLGMHILFNLISQSLKGKILDVISSPGNGTVFQISLPLNIEDDEDIIEGEVE